MDPDDLYGLPLDRFVPERGALAKTLRKAGRRDDAAAVAALRKPSVAAWAVNQLVRTQRAALRELLDTGDALRAAQAGLLEGGGDARALRANADRERAAVEELVGIARGLLSSRGGELSPTVLERVADTLHAAALDEDAREQVRHGRLERELRHVGLGLGLGHAVELTARRQPREQTGPEREEARAPARQGEGAGAVRDVMPSSEGEGEGEASGAVRAVVPGSGGEGEGEAAGAVRGVVPGSGGEGEGEAAGAVRGVVPGSGGEGEGEAPGAVRGVAPGSDGEGEGEAPGAVRDVAPGSAGKGELASKRARAPAPKPARKRAQADREEAERRRRERLAARRDARAAHATARRRAGAAAEALRSAQERRDSAARDLADAEHALAAAGDHAREARAALERAEAEVARAEAAG